jgi:hypothetical protein
MKLGCSNGWHRWLFAFITTALVDHEPFLVDELQPIMDRCQASGSFVGYDLSTEFMHALLVLIRDHLRAHLLPQLITKPAYFRHLIDEILMYCIRLCCLSYLFM